MPAALTQAAYESSSVLAGLSKAVPRLRKELPGWVAGHLAPALDGFVNDASEAQLADALAALRNVLRQRGNIDPWLKDIANLGMGEYTGDPRAMTSPAKLTDRVALSPQPIGNRTVVEQARQLRAALVPTPTIEEQRATPLPATKPDAK